MTGRRRVVVTGLGAVSPVGNDVATTWEALLAGRSGIGPITRFDASGLSCRIAGEVKNFDLSGYISPKEARRMDVFIHFGIAASVQAIKDSGLEITDANRERIGCVIGSGIGGLPMIEDNHSELLERGPRRVSPFLIPGSIINMIAGNLSIQYGLKGPNLAIVTACTTGLHSIGEAGRLIEHGDADVMVAGGSEATICPLGIGGFDSMKALSTRNDDPATASRPWDRDRDGFVMGEGAGIVVLEDYEHERGCLPHDRARHGRGATLHGCCAAQRPDQCRRGELPERARDVHAAGRLERDQRHQGRARRRRQEHRRQLDEIDDRAPARGRRRGRIGGDGAGGASPDFAADDQHLQSGP
jgi:3-oxoacyl-[acyl-carrier-protein] synthase III